MFIYNTIRDERGGGDAGGEAGGRGAQEGGVRITKLKQTMTGFELSLSTSQIVEWILVCDCNVYIIQKLKSSFFPKKNLICANYTFSHYVLILFIHCILLSKEILLIPKITPQNGKNALQFLNIFSFGGVNTLLRSGYILQSEIIWTLI